VVEAAAAQVAAVLADQRRVVELDPGVDVGDHHGVAPDAEGRPDLGGADPVDVPLDRLDPGPLLRRGGPRDLEPPLGHHPCDLRQGGDLGQQLRPGRDLHGVGDPERLVGHLAAGQQPAQAGLALGGVGPQPLVDLGGALAVPFDPGRGPQIGLVLQDHEEGGRALGLDLVQDLPLDLVGILGRGRGAGAERRPARRQRRQQDGQGQSELDRECETGAAAAARRPADRHEAPSSWRQPLQRPCRW
jgi:hypothetical protein